jgi:Zn-dependent peptidase ImmA (M78 family)
VTLPRGFGANAERLAQKCLLDSGQKGKVPVDIKAVAARRNVPVISADKLVPLKQLHDIEKLQAFAFSACTFEINNRKIIVFNPIHNVGRSNSDIAHELGHILLEHILSEIQEVGGLPFRVCQPEQEEQATALGSAILVPEKELLDAAYKGASIELIARQFEVTVPMARFRWNKVGVSRRLERRNQSRASER